jgi:hypothetical protein
MERGAGRDLRASDDRGTARETRTRERPSEGVIKPGRDGSTREYDQRERDAFVPEKRGHDDTRD